MSIGAGVDSSTSLRKVHEDVTVDLRECRKPLSMDKRNLFSVDGRVKTSHGPRFRRPGGTTTKNNKRLSTNPYLLPQAAWVMPPIGRRSANIGGGARSQRNGRMNKRLSVGERCISKASNQIEEVGSAVNLEIQTNKDGLRDEPTTKLEASSGAPENGSYT